jgi:hypothetical protein
MRIESCVHPNYFVIDGRTIHEVSIPALVARGLLENPEQLETARGLFMRQQASALEGAEAMALLSQDAVYRLDDNGGIMAGREFNFTEFSIPDGVRAISKSGFHGIEVLESITIPSSVESIEDDAFNGCRNLVNVQLTYGLKRIGARAFHGSAIRELILPASVEFISPRGVFPRTGGYVYSDPSISVDNIKAIQACRWRVRTARTRP